MMRKRVLFVHIFAIMAAGSRDGNFPRQSGVGGAIDRRGDEQYIRPATLDV
jgi:hypothetical protein